MTAAEESTNNIIMDTTGAEFIPVAIQKVAITGCIKRPITKLLHTLVKNCLLYTSPWDIITTEN